MIPDKTTHSMSDIEECGRCLERLRSLGCQVGTAYYPKNSMPHWKVVTPAGHYYSYGMDSRSLKSMRRLCEELDIPTRRSERIAQVIG